MTAVHPARADLELALATTRPMFIAEGGQALTIWHIGAALAGAGVAAAVITLALGGAYWLQIGLGATALFALCLWRFREDPVDLRLALAAAASFAAVAPIAVAAGMAEWRWIVVIDVVFVPAAIAAVVGYVRAQRVSAASPNLLRDVFGEFVAEQHGVQFVLLFPRGKLICGTTARVRVLVHNATDAERTIQLHLEEGGLLPGAAALALPPATSFALSAGECGVLVSEIEAWPDTGASTYLHAAMVVDAVGGRGTRLVPWRAPFASPRSLTQARRADRWKLLGVLSLYHGHALMLAPSSAPVDSAKLPDPQAHFFALSPAELRLRLG